MSDLMPSPWNERVSPPALASRAASTIPLHTSKSIGAQPRKPGGDNQARTDKDT